MAQEETPTSSDPSLSRNASFSRLSAQAAEFVPTRPTPPPPPSVPFHVPIQVVVPPPPPTPPHAVPVHHHLLPAQYHHHHHHQYPYSGFGDQEMAAPEHQQNHLIEQSHSDHGSSSKSHKLSDEATSKILNQVEYYFSDLNLATTDHLMRFINKDPQGFVPISVVASFKKIKSLVSSNAQLATILRSSSKLAVHEDGKKIRRQHPLTQSDMEELQSRIVVAENLPDDHCHQNLMKVFSAAGSVKTIRTCQPQTSNSGASSASRSAKADSMLFSNKLHAFVEYESAEVAEKAVAELCDEGNWRSGLKVRLMLRRTSKPAQVRVKKGEDGELQLEEADVSTPEQLANEKQPVDSYQQSDTHSHEHVEEHGNDRESGRQRKGRNRGRGRGRGQGQSHPNNSNNNNRGNYAGPLPNNMAGSIEKPGIGKPPPGPRMPDGTRGFAMGRGKAVAVNIA